GAAQAAADHRAARGEAAARLPDHADRGRQADKVLAARRRTGRERATLVDAAAALLGRRRQGETGGCVAGVFPGRGSGFGKGDGTSQFKGPGFGKGDGTSQFKGPVPFSEAGTEE